MTGLSAAGMSVLTRPSVMSSLSRAGSMVFGDDENMTDQERRFKLLRGKSNLSIHSFKKRKTVKQLGLRRTSVVNRRYSIAVDPTSFFFRVERLVASPYFDPVFTALIVVNAVVMGFELQYHGMDIGHAMGYPGEDQTAERVWPAAVPIFKACEWFFGCLFTLELLFKLVALKRAFVKDYWNLMDTVIVLSWFVGSFSSVLPLNPTVLRLVRLVRLLRMLRLVRTLHGFESLYLMTASIKASLLALVWSGIILFLVQVAIALVLNALLLNFMLDEDNPPEKRKEVYRYFGTFSKALLTLFEFLLANWPPASRVLTENVSEWYVIFILGYQCVIGFAVLKVIMGVFLRVTFNVAETDDVIMQSQKEKQVKMHTKKIERLFEKIDEDGNHVVDREEFRKMVGNDEVRRWLAAMDCDVSLFARDPDVLFSLVDDGDEELTVEELVKGVAHMQGLARSIDLFVFADRNRVIREALQQVSADITALKSRGLWDEPRRASGGCDRRSRTTGGSRTDSLCSSQPSRPSSSRRTGSQSEGTEDLSQRSSVAVEDVEEAQEESVQEEEREGEEEAVDDDGFAASSPSKPIGRAATRASAVSRGNRVSRGSVRAGAMEKRNTRASVSNEMFQRGYQRRFSGTSLGLTRTWDALALKAADFVTSPRFDAAFGIFIIINTLVLVLQVQYTGIDTGFRLRYDGCTTSAREAWPQAEEFFVIADWFFLVVFCLEALIKMLGLRRDFVRDAWNWFDLVLVAFGIVEVSFAEGLLLDSGLLRLARMMRLLRMLRFVKYTRAFDSVYLMATAIIGSLYHLFWFCVLMLVIQTFLTLVLATMLESYFSDDSVPEGERHGVYKYYGTFSKAMLTMFEITLANWIPACRALSENVSEWYMIWALIHKFVIGFAVVMVITAVLLQETFRVALTDDNIMLNERRRQIKAHNDKMSRLFIAADDDKNGILDRHEFSSVARVRAVATWMASQGMDLSDADSVFTMVSQDFSNGGEYITADDLVMGMAHLKGPAKSLDLNVVMRENAELLREATLLKRKVLELKDMRRPTCMSPPLEEQDEEGESAGVVMSA